MLTFDYTKLPREYPRRFVLANLSLEWENLGKIFDELQNRRITSAEDLKQWLADEWELNAVLYQERTLRYVMNSSQTDNPDYEKAYLHFLEELEPKIKLRNFELEKKYVSSSFRGELPRDLYFVLDRKRENSVSLFRSDNIELEKRDAELAQQYQKLIGTMTVSYGGEERTLQQMSRFYEETDRRVRKGAWELSEERRLKEIESVNRIYDELVKNRQTVAENAGFGNFRDYAFRKQGRFDYSPEDCYHFHEAVEKYIVPLSREMDRERWEKLGVEDLRPWDLVVDPEGRPPLRPFDSAGELVQGCARVFERVDLSFVKYFTRMIDLNLFDLESRRGKAPGGYMEDLTDVRLPFIFMNAVGRDSDVRTLLHESGHSFHTFLTRDRGFPVYHGQNVSTEFAEVASTTMELIGGEHLDGTFYNGEDAMRSNRNELNGVVKLFRAVATIDAFQHWVYTHPEHTREEREDEYVKLFRRFSGLESWEGYETHLRNRWQKVLHLFEVPFYYIEYGIATLGALGIWVRYRKEPREAITAYKNALSFGASRSLPELFAAAALPWDFGPTTVERYADEVRRALAD